MTHLKSYSIILICALFFSFCKKDNQNVPAAQASSSSVPCNAANLVVDSINEVTGQNKIYKLTVTNYTLTAPSGNTAVIGAIEQVTMGVIGDTLINNTTGKRYRIRSTNGWDFKAYSYKDQTDSLWHLKPHYTSNGGEVFFETAFKLPLTTNQSYTYTGAFQTHNCSVSGPVCIPVNYINYPVYKIGDYFSSSPDVFVTIFNVNKTGLLDWTFTQHLFQTQNPEQHAYEWHFEKIN